MPMDMEHAIRVDAAAPDSHFRLLPCPACQSENVAYVQYMLGRQEPWKVRCFDCGFTVDQQKIFKHEAQVAWNKVCQDRKEKPCLNCPDRTPGCSDHCKKPDFLNFRAKQAKIREAQQREKAIWGYTANEIRKNRRVR